MNLVTNLCNPFSSLYEYIFGHEYIFISILLCLNLTYLIVKSKLVLELSLFVKQKNMNKLFLELFINNLVYL